MKRLWFKRKLYGWGWTPVTWEGWLALLLYLLGIIYLLGGVGVSSSEKDLTLRVVFPCIGLSFLLIVLCYFKGEKPRWQWGKRKEE